jgi:hypothetical protein
MVQTVHLLCLSCHLPRQKDETNTQYGKRVRKFFEDHNLRRHPLAWPTGSQLPPAAPAAQAAQACVEPPDEEI